MAAGSTMIRAVLLGPPRDATVLAAFPGVAYLRLEPGDPDVVALLARDAVRLPIGLAIEDAAVRRPFAQLRPGDPATVGGGGIQAGGQAWRVLRWWDPVVPRLDSPACPGGSVSAPALPAVAVPDTSLLAPARLLARALDSSRLDPDAVDRAVLGLVGLGPGLTPAGDDLLCGALAALAAAGPRDTVAVLAAAAARHAARTTPISAALLRCACSGAAIPQLAELLTALRRSGTAERLARARASLSTVGHSTGNALAAGALIALGARTAGSEAA